MGPPLRSKSSYNLNLFETAVVDWERKKPVKTTLKSFAVVFIIAIGSFGKNSKNVVKTCSHMYYSANLDKDDSYLYKKRLKSLSVPNAKVKM